MIENSVLYCLPLGVTMRDKFIEEARKMPMGEALVVLPGRFFREEVHRAGFSGSAIIDFLPNELLRSNGQEGYRRIDRLAQEMLIRSLLAEMSARQELKYFEGLCDKEGIVQSIIAFISELSHDNVDIEEFSSALSNMERAHKLMLKDSEVISIYKLYRERLLKSGYYDIDGMYRLAIAVLQKETCHVPWKKLFFSEFYRFNALQLELVEELAKYCSVEIGLFYDEKEQDLSRVSAALRQELIGVGFRQVKVDAPSRQPAESLTIIEAHDVQEEMRGVLRSIKQKLLDGAICSDILCLARNLDSYSGLSNLFAEYGIPLALPQVTSLGSQPLSSFFCDILLTALNANDVKYWQKLCKNNLLTQLYSMDTALLEKTYNDRFFSTPKALRQFILTNMQQTGIEDLFSLIGELGKEHTTTEFYAIIQARLQKWRLPMRYGELYQNGDISLSELNVLVKTHESIIAFLKRFSNAFIESGRGQEKVSVAEVLRCWHKEGASQKLVLSYGEAQGVKVQETAEVQGVSFPYVYLMGLREGEFPQQRHEDWLYNERERQELVAQGINLALNIEDRQQDRYFFAAAAVIAEKELTVSYYTDDAAGASPYLDDLREMVGKELPKIQTASSDTLSAFSEVELANLLIQRDNLLPQEEKWLQALLGKEFRQRCTLDEARFKGQNEYNGFLSQGDERSCFSASSLDTYKQCPFFYLGQNFWQLMSWEELDGSTPPTVTGELYHEILAQFLAKHANEKLSATNIEVLENELGDLFNVIYGKFETCGKITVTEFSSYEKQNHQKALKRWLHSEWEYQKKQSSNMRPAFFERAFGKNEAGSLPAYQRIIEGEKVIFTGRIDRIDTDGTNYFLTDYKSGDTPTGKAVAAGEAMQLPLYIMAVTEGLKLDGKQISGAGYYTLKDGKRQGGLWQLSVMEDLPWLLRKRFAEYETILSTAQKSIDEGVKGIKKGYFPVEPLHTCPAYCPYADICRERIRNSDDQGGDDNV